MLLLVVAVVVVLEVDAWLDVVLLVVEVEDVWLDVELPVVWPEEAVLVLPVVEVWLPLVLPVVEAELPEDWLEAVLEKALPVIWLELVLPVDEALPIAVLPDAEAELTSEPLPDDTVRLALEAAEDEEEASRPSHSTMYGPRSVLLSSLLTYE